jgi:hypothetical protein
MITLSSDTTLARRPGGRTDGTVQLAIETYGVRIGLRVNRVEAMDELAPHLPPGWKATPFAGLDRVYAIRIGHPDGSKAAAEPHLLDANGEPVARAWALDELWDALESDLQLYVAVSAQPYVFVHAGVVGWRGGAILLPGRSFSGKTTLVAALLRRGAIYYSDEYAVLGPDGRVHPYPRPLSIRVPGHPVAHRCPVERFGSVVGTEPLPVRQIVITRYRPGVTGRLRPLASGPAALALLANTVPARQRPAEVLATLHRAILPAASFTGARGEADPTASILLEGAR